MKAHLTATALCAVLMAQPAAAQQDQPRATTPSRAETNPTTNPMADPHKDGSRQENHGGTVHAPQVNAAAPLPADMKPTAESLARNTITAQQYGNFESKRHTSGAVHDLADRMTLTNNRMNRALTAAAPDLGDVQIPEKERGPFDADATQFGVSVAQGVVQSYAGDQRPRETRRAGQLSELTSSAVPIYKAQLSDAQRILQSASASTNAQPTSTGTVIDPKKASD